MLRGTFKRLHNLDFENKLYNIINILIFAFFQIPKCLMPFLYSNYPEQEFSMLIKYSVNKKMVRWPNLWRLNLSTPKMKQMEIEKELGYSSSTLQPYRQD